MSGVERERERNQDTKKAKDKDSRGGGMEERVRTLYLRRGVVIETVRPTELDRVKNSDPYLKSSSQMSD